jgi:hypothetical protein
MESNNYVLGAKVRKTISAYNEGKEFKEEEIIKYSPKS